MKLLIFFLSCYSAIAFSQGGRVVLASSYLVIDNQAKLVVETGTPNAIVNSGSGGIITESEFDQVIWSIANNTGTYIMPFVSQGTLTQLPFTCNITAPGIGSGRIAFSTYPGATWNNNTYRPSDVTHMGNIAVNVNNSDNVIDRFWIIDPLTYTTKPTAVFNFTYRDVEHLQVGNTIVESDLGAQRFNSSLGIWGDYLPQGSTNVASNVTSGVPVSPANFFRSWTLSEILQPLGVDVVAFYAVCDNESVSLNWETEQEINVDYFTVELFNGESYDLIEEIDASGSQNSYYSVSTESRTTGLFRLCEVDLDGVKTEKGTLYVNCWQDNETISYINGGILITYHSVGLNTEPFTIYDMSGRLVYSCSVDLKNGGNTVFIPQVTLAEGSYVAQIGSGSHLVKQHFLKY
jgi:hypothetical protein